MMIFFDRSLPVGKPVAEVSITYKIAQAEKKGSPRFCPRRRSETQRQRTAKRAASQFPIYPFPLIRLHYLSSTATDPLQVLIPYGSPGEHFSVIRKYVPRLS